jgi:thiol-disulfide isomerase/thioredoxin
MVRSQSFVFTLLAWAACAAAFQQAAAETVLLDFTQAGCGPCAEMEPVLQQLATEGVRIRRVDVQRQPDAARDYRVDSTPTYIVIIDGREWARVAGRTSHAVMVEMLEKAALLARSHAPRAQGPRGATVTPVALGDSSQPAASDAQTLASSSPQEGRVVPIQDPFAIRTPPESAAPAAATARGAASPAPAVDVAHLIAATVRLSVTDPKGKSTGTGVIVDSRNGMALVLTCGHIFRESKGAGPIEISMFAAGPNGAELRGAVAGELYTYDLDRDLALVRFRTESPVTVTPIAPAGTQLEPGAPVTSVGCSHGENPTAWASRITRINRYQGHPNVEAGRAPVEGRSGGGLFNAQGQVIGVCFASDPASDEGLYASLASIHAKLDELQLATVYQSPSVNVAGAQAPPANQLAVATPDPAPRPEPEAIAVRGQSPTPAASLALASALPTSGSATAVGPQGASAAAGTTPDPATAFAGLTPQEQATLEEIARRSGGSEVICIISPRSPNGRSDVIKLSGVSPAFIRALAASAETASLASGQRGSVR